MLICRVESLKAIGSEDNFIEQKKIKRYYVYNNFYYNYKSIRIINLYTSTTM